MQKMRSHKTTYKRFFQGCQGVGDHQTDFQVTGMYFNSLLAARQAKFNINNPIEHHDNRDSCGISHHG
jgi:hypothetical protein